VSIWRLVTAYGVNSEHCIEIRAIRIPEKPRLKAREYIPIGCEEIAWSIVDQHGVRHIGRTIP